MVLRFMKKSDVNWEFIPTMAVDAVTGKGKKIRYWFCRNDNSPYCGVGRTPEAARANLNLQVRNAAKKKPSYSKYL
jgi:hypothetical protein